MSAKVPKNIRFRQDQIDALAEMEDAETDFSELVRRAVDDLLARRRAARVKETPPSYGQSKKKTPNAQRRTPNVESKKKR